MRLLNILVGPFLALNLAGCGLFAPANAPASRDADGMPGITSSDLGTLVLGERHAARKAKPALQTSSKSQNDVGTDQTAIDGQLDPVRMGKSSITSTSTLPLPPAPPQDKGSTPPPTSPKPIAVGDSAFTVESVRCEGIAGVWATVLKGTVAAIEGDMVWLQLNQRLGVGYHPAETGINSTDWYCVPRRKYCYAPIGFSDWGGRYQQGMSGSFSRDKSFREDTRLILGIAPILEARCP